MIVPLEVVPPLRSTSWGKNEELYHYDEGQDVSVKL